MKCSKTKGTTGKIEPSQQFISEEKLTFQKKISGANFYYDIPTESIVNLDQTPLSYVSPGKYAFQVKGVETVPIKGIDKKRQITAIFAVSLSKEFFPFKFFMRAKQQDVYLSALLLKISTWHFLKIIGPTRKRPLAFLKKLYFFISKMYANLRGSQMSRWIFL